MQIKIGHGFDVHQLLESAAFAQKYPNRNTDALYLGGLPIPYHKRLVGHSDADVLLHAIIDALLGAAGLADIGVQFADDDKSYEAISSLELLKRTLVLVNNAGYEVGNIDATVLAERPKLRPYISSMRAIIAETLGINLDQVNVKATTTEGLGFTGREEGIAAHAVCLLVKNPNNV